jgi:UDP-N-acetylglucosamine--N-acetylmuramyl-(pentapeptide) pyrophosphoryl-undecaprenol N-acetylglucosamine transferase
VSVSLAYVRQPRLQRGPTFGPGGGARTEALPGIANRLGARFTDHVAVTFAGTPLRGAQVLGMPLRRQITTLDRAALRAEARQQFGLRPELPTLLVVGGSLGAQRLNITMGTAAAALADAGIQELHAAGPRGKTVDVTAPTTAVSRPPP